jgi:hypothetical protein
MTRVLFAMATVALFAAGIGTASAQTVVVPVSPQPVAPTYAQPVVGGTIVTSPGVVVTGVIAPPTIVVSPALPIVRVGYPYYYGRPYYGYPHYRFHW